MRVYLDLLTGKKADFNTLFSGADAFFDYFIAYIIYMIMVGVGMIFLILPGIYLALKYQYVFPLIIDKKMSAFDAIKKSGELTQGNIFNLFGLAVLLFLVILAGLLALGVGVLIAAPVASLAYVHVYKQLSK